MSCLFLKKFKAFEEYNNNFPLWTVGTANRNDASSFVLEK